MNMNIFNCFRSQYNDLSDYNDEIGFAENELAQNELAQNDKKLAKEEIEELILERTKICKNDKAINYQSLDIIQKWIDGRKTIIAKTPEEMKSEIFEILTKETNINPEVCKTLLDNIQDIQNGYPQKTYTASSQVDSVLECVRGCRDIVSKDQDGIAWVFVDEPFYSKVNKNTIIRPGWYPQNFISITTGFKKPDIQLKYKNLICVNSLSNGHTNMLCKEISYYSRDFFGNDYRQVLNSETRLQLGKWEIRLFYAKATELIQLISGMIESSDTMNEGKLSDKELEEWNKLQEEWNKLHNEISDPTSQGKLVSRPDLMIQLLNLKNLVENRLKEKSSESVNEVYLKNAKVTQQIQVISEKIDNYSMNDLYKNPNAAQSIGQQSLCPLSDKEFAAWTNICKEVSDLALKGKLASRPDLMLKLLAIKKMVKGPLGFYKKDDIWGTGIGCKQEESLNLLGKSLETVCEYYSKMNAKEIVREINLARYGTAQKT